MRSVNSLGGAQCCGPLECEKLYFPGEAKRLLLPSFLSSMSSSFYSPFLFELNTNVNNRMSYILPKALKV